MKEDVQNRAISPTLLVGVGALAGVLAFGLIRAAFLPRERPIHYHANFAIFVDGERLDLSGDRYMEDVVSCRADPTRVEPEDRAHLHGKNPDVVHVHDAAVTWGHFLANLGFGIGDDYLVLDRGGRYMATTEAMLKFVLNGASVRSIRNVVIHSNDRLLISFGAEDVEEAVRTQFPEVGSNAAEFDETSDPASCAGPREPSFWQKVRRGFWL